MRGDTKPNPPNPDAPPPPPAGLGRAGARLWSQVVERYELESHEARLLLEMARTVDSLDVLADVVAAEGSVLHLESGPKVHPALVEIRQLRIAYARLCAALRLPAGEDAEGEGRRPQRRVGVRGTYAFRSVQ